MLIWVLTGCHSPKWTSQREIDEMADNICIKMGEVEHIKDSLYKSNTLLSKDKNTIKKLEETLKVYVRFSDENDRESVRDVDEAMDSLYNYLLKLSGNKQENIKKMEKDTNTTKSKWSKNNRHLPLG